MGIATPHVVEAQAHPLMPATRVGLKRAEAHRHHPRIRPLPGTLGAVIDTVLAGGRRRPSDEQQMFLLSGPDDPQTMRLKAAIRNDLRSEHARIRAFTQGQRYTRLEYLTKASVTSDLVRVKRGASSGPAN